MRTGAIQLLLALVAGCSNQSSTSSTALEKPPGDADAAVRAEFDSFLTITWPNPPPSIVQRQFTPNESGVDRHYQALHEVKEPTWSKGILFMVRIDEIATGPNDKPSPELKSVLHRNATN